MEDNMHPVTLLSETAKAEMSKAERELKRTEEEMTRLVGNLSPEERTTLQEEVESLPEGAFLLNIKSALGDTNSKILQEQQKNATRLLSLLSPEELKDLESEIDATDGISRPPLDLNTALDVLNAKARAETKAEESKAEEKPKGEERVPKFLVLESENGALFLADEVYRAVISAEEEAYGITVYYWHAGEHKEASLYTKDPRVAKQWKDTLREMDNTKVRESRKRAEARSKQKEREKADAIRLSFLSFEGDDNSVSVRADQILTANMWKKELSGQTIYGFAMGYGNPIMMNSVTTRDPKIADRWRQTLEPIIHIKQ